uniref:Uncharacterized protein n=1 Tax=Physcomitrium patens TaxID=3218 RepID=A0A2K1JR07_PHYPA|nr:hypothetical protein PHYPA_016351 [Physcomitrium patens]
MKWVQCGPGDFAGDPPSLRSGHSAVRVKGNRVVVFGGLYDKSFLHDLHVLDIENKLWFQPTCTGTAGEAGLVGPSPRAFHVAVAIDCNMFIFGGRYGRKRLGDFWMLDTETWQWVELTGYGDLPPARDFAAGASVGNGKLVIYGGWDGSKWLSDVYVLNTLSFEWMPLPITGPAPSPRCGHSATMVEKRMLIFGGRGGGGPIMGDLWALKGLFDEEQEPPAWTQLKLPGSGPAPRCGHSTTSGGSQLLVFGGHGTGGWITRYDIYHNDCVILDRATVQWKRLSVSNEPPPARAYHTMTRIGPRFLLIGGYDGKTTFGDMWWLVNEEDEIAKRALLSPASSLKSPGPNTLKSPPPSTDSKTEAEGITSPLHDLRQRLGLPAIAAAEAPEIASDDKELLALGKGLLSEADQNSPATATSLLKVVRAHWNQSNAQSIQLRELSPLLRDYRRLLGTHQSEISRVGGLDGEGTTLQIYRFYHLKDANQIRIADIPALLSEYKQLLYLHADLD